MRTPTICFSVCAGVIAFMSAIATASCVPKIDSPTSDDGRAIIVYTRALAACQAVGRDAGTYKAYDNCKREAGLE